MTNYVFSLLSAKPQYGIAVSLGGFASSILSWLQITTPLIGFIAAFSGMLAGIATAIIKFNDLRKSIKDAAASASAEQPKN